MSKLLYITPYFPEPHKKAGSKFTFNQISVLNSLGYEIDLISITKFDSLDITPLEAITSTCSYYKRESSIFWYTLALTQSMLFNESIFLTLLSNRFENSVKEKLNETDYDRIFLEHSYMGLWFMKRFPYIDQSKMTVVMHNIESEYFYYMYKNDKSSLLLKVFNYLEYRFLRENESLLIKSDIKQLYLNSNDCKRDNHYFLPSFPFRLVQKDKEYEIKYDLLYFGLLSSERNMNALFYFLDHVFSYVLKEVDTTLVVAGKGISQKNYKKLSTYRNIQYLGEVDSIKNLYFSSKVVINPILENIGVQTKLYEALSFQSCVACTDYAIDGLLFQNKKEVLSSNDDKTFAQNIITLLIDENMRKNIKKSISNIEKEIRKTTYRVLGGEI